MEEEARRLAVLGEAIEISATGVQEGVSRRGGRGEDDGVDDGRQDGDGGTADGDDPGRGSRTGVVVLLRREQVLVVIWHQHTQEEGAENVEEEDTPEDSLDGLGDVLARVLRLTGSAGDGLDTTEGKGSVDERREEAQEASLVAGAEVLVHGAWVLPVPEADAVAGRTAAEVDDEGEQQQADDGDDLDTGEDELSLAVDRDGPDVEEDDDGDDQADPCSDVDVLRAGPVLDDDGGR